MRRVYHLPGPLANQAPLLDRWTDLTHRVTLRRVNIPNPTIDAEHLAAELPRCPPNSPKELSKVETDMAPKNIFNLEASDEDPMSAWTSAELSATLDDLVQVTEGPFPGETEPFHLPPQPSGDSLTKPNEMLTTL